MHPNGVHSQGYAAASLSPVKQEQFILAKLLSYMAGIELDKFARFALASRFSTKMSSLTPPAAPLSYASSPSLCQIHKKPIVFLSQVYHCPGLGYPRSNTQELALCPPKSNFAYCADFAEGYSKYVGLSGRCSGPTLPASLPGPRLRASIPHPRPCLGWMLPRATRIRPQRRRQPGCWQAMPPYPLPSEHGGARAARAH